MTSPGSSAAPTSPTERTTGATPGGALSAAGWALSMAVTDRRNAVRLLVMALGIACCTFVLLALATIGPMVTAMNGRAAASTPQSSGDSGAFSTLPVSISNDGRAVNGMVVHAVGRDAPAPPGTARFPGDGELLASPALAELLADPRQENLRAVVPGTVVGLIDPSVLFGARDLYFYQGSATLAGAEFATGWGVPPGEHPLDPRVWSLLITGTVIVLVPLLLFTALAGRIGAARRDRRSATLRLLGASASRLRLLVAGEAVMAAVAGLVLAGAGYLAARVVAARVQVSGRGIQLSDVTPAVGSTLAILVGVPLLAVAATFTGFRRTVGGPLAVLNRTRRAPRAGWRIALVVAAAAAGGWAAWRRRSNSDYGYSVTDIVLICLVVALALFAVAALVGLITDRLARRWVGGSVAGVLGRRRIVQDGSTTTRAAAGLATVLAGFVVLMTLLSGSSYANVQSKGTGPTTYLGWVPNLRSDEWVRLQASVASVPGVESAYLSTSLAGSSDGHVVSVANCAAVLAMTQATHCRNGDAFAVTLAGQAPLRAGPITLQLGNGQVRTWTPPGNLRRVAESSPDDLPLSPTDYLLTPAAAEPQFAGLLAQQTWVQVVVRMPVSATDGVQRAVSWLGWRGYGMLSLSERTNVDSSPVPWIRAGLLGCGVLTLLICALGQGLVGSEQIRERRRAFALARASGVPLGVLGRSVLHAALLPVSVGLGLAAVTGAGLAPFIQYLRGALSVPSTWPWIAIGTAAALAVGILVAAGSTVGLRARTGPAALRTE